MLVDDDNDDDDDDVAAVSKEGSSATVEGTTVPEEAGRNPDGTIKAEDEPRARGSGVTLGICDGGARERRFAPVALGVLLEAGGAAPVRGVARDTGVRTDAPGTPGPRVLVGAALEPMMFRGLADTETERGRRAGIGGAN